MARSSRRRNPLKSIHDPPDPSPRKLPEDARKVWNDAYAEADQAYGRKELAERAAWRTVKLKWKQTGKKTWQRCRDGICTPWPHPQMLPDPVEDLVPLGVLIEYSFLDKAGELQIRECAPEHPPILWWDEGRKALYAFPRQPYPDTCNPIPADMAKAVDLYETWHQRKPTCAFDISVPMVRIKAIGAGDTVSYRSDKWHDHDPDPRVLQAQEYIHNHWYDVWVWQDADSDLPHVIMIQGGELALHARGLIH